MRKDKKRKYKRKRKERWLERRKGGRKKGGKKYSQPAKGLKWSANFKRHLSRNKSSLRTFRLRSTYKVILHVSRAPFLHAYPHLPLFPLLEGLEFFNSKLRRDGLPTLLRPVAVAASAARRVRERIYQARLAQKCVRIRQSKHNQTAAMRGAIRLQEQQV
jgi:hypothetical protein